MKSQMSIVFILALGSALANHHWSYDETGPNYWSEEYSACGGKAQSPINIRTSKAKNVFFNRKLKFKKYQVPLTGIFVDNGHSMQFNPTDSSRHILHGGALMGKNKYEFLQFHFHWGSDDSHGSEHTVDGFRYPMEMHMVHVNTKYTDNVTAAYENQDGFAVIGIFAMVANDNITNEVFDPVVEAANELIVDPEAEVEKTLTLQDFLDQVEGSNYFSYQGSLTTPGCNEAVSWIIMNQPVLIAESQIAALRLLTTETGAHLVDNFRPIQDLNNRVVSHFFPKSRKSPKNPKVRDHEIPKI